MPLAILVSIALADTSRVEELTRAALSLDADVEHGGEFYRSRCQECHGAQAQGDPEQLVPALASQRQRYLVKQLADFVELERESDEMHKIAAVAGLDDPQRIIDLATYLNGQAPVERPQTGDGTLVNLGEAMFQEQCASCHGADARGDEDGSVPSLRNQHYVYLLHQMRLLGTGHRTDIDADLARFLKSLDGEEMAGIADYLSRLQGPVTDRRHMRDDGTVTD